MTSSKILLCLLLSFIGGVFIASFFDVPGLIFYELLLLGVFYLGFSLALGLRNKKQEQEEKKQKRHFCLVLLIFSACLLVFALGIWRASGIEFIESRSLLATENGTLSFLTFLKQRFQQVIDQNLSPPQSGILSAVLLGNKYELSRGFKEKLNIAGVRHITAISGMHIVILSGILLWLGVAIGLYRGQAFYFAVAFLWLFILMIGFQPSAIRAGIMGTMFLFCDKIGRQKTADRALLLTAAVMLAINPTLLRYSIGFQLSFLATLGIIYLMPLFQQFFNVLTSNIKTSMFGDAISKHWGKGVISLLSMSLAAQVFVLPLLIYYFGQVSIVSPLTNLIIVPLLPLLMVSGFLFVIAGAIWHPLAFVFFFPVWFLLTYVTKIVDLFAGFSFSAINFQTSWLWLPVAYSLLGVLLWQIKKRQKLKLLP